MYPLWTELTVTVKEDGLAKSATIDSGVTGGPVAWNKDSQITNILKFSPTNGTLFMPKSALDNAVQSLFPSSDADDVTQVSVKVFLTYLTGCDLNDHPASGMLNTASATFTVGGAITAP